MLATEQPKSTPPKLMSIEEINYFKGWNDAYKAITKHIQEMSSHWLENGPSKATANAILKKISQLESPIKT